MAVVRVAAAVLLRADGRVLLAQRLPGTPYAGWWEFPGGKLEPGESPRHALERELGEELGIALKRASPWLVQRYVYPHAEVELNFFRVFDWIGEPSGRDGQAVAWQLPCAFDVAPLLPANTRVLAALRLPPIYGITCASDLGQRAFLESAESAFARGLRLVQVREKEWPAGRLRALAIAVRDIARAYGAVVLLNGDVAMARELGLDGVHWTSAQLLDAASRPQGLLVGASCHDARELEHAAALDCDFAVLGPVKATPSHTAMRPIGWTGFERFRERARIPVYALGGLDDDDLDIAIDHGAHGIAMRRGAWAERRDA
ncbi:MAG TPA: Nudix family hydrolase [Casimicrobiaceae bacterium]|nr:Nudix family hydrolase [Casimicrobiaceae bacterium]